MKAAVIEEFCKPLTIQNVQEPQLEKNSVIVRVKATGICRSDWHGWMGHDPDIHLPHVPGHELSGIIEDCGKEVKRLKKGDRVTVPFVGGCGNCPQCNSGNHQICDYQFQPGFTHWGSFAEYVSIKYADVNVVKIPDQLDFITAASLGCRFITSFRAVVAQGKVTAGEWVAVHGCGGVGLSAIIIAKAIGAEVIAIDINPKILQKAKSLGAEHIINATEIKNSVELIKDISKGGAHVSIDALGSQPTCFNSISCLRKRGKHIQVGLMVADYSKPTIPMDKVIAHELEIYGSHGMQAYKYDTMLNMILSGKLKPDQLIGKTVTLQEALKELERMDEFENVGITVIDRF